MSLLERLRLHWGAIAIGLATGAVAAWGAGYAVEAYRLATVTYHVPVAVRAISVAGQRLLSVHFGTGAVRYECANATQWYLTAMRGGELLKFPLLVTVNGVRQQSDAAFELWLPIPISIPAGHWSLYYRTASTCPWLLWYVVTVWNSEPGEVDIP